MSFSQSLADRNVYRHSYQVDFLRFIPVSLLAIGMGILCGLLLTLLKSLGIYFSVVFPVSIALLAATSVIWAIRWGRCRNPWVGLILGSIVGLLITPGMLYYQYLTTYGFEFAIDLDLLGRYVVWYWENQIFTTRSGREYQSTPLSIFLTVMEFISVQGVMLYMIRNAFDTPYCEVLQTWMTKHHFVLNDAQATRMREILNTTTSQASDPYSSILQGTTDSKAILVYAFDERQQLGDQTYVSFENATFSKKWGKDFRILFGTIYYELTRTEVEEIAQWSPALHTLVVKDGPHHSSIISTDTTISIDPNRPWWGTFMDTPVLTTEAYIVASLTAWVPVALGMLCWFVGLWSMAQPNREELLRTVAAPCALGGFLFMCSAWFTRSFGVVYLNSLLKQRVKERPTPLVDPEEIDACFVEYQPRAGWTKVSLFSDAEDGGYLKVDLVQNQLLFEGDRYRWQIASSQIVQSEIEQTDLHLHAKENNHPPTYALVLQIKNGDTITELPLSILRWNRTEKLSSNSYDRSMQLAYVLATLRSTDEP